jgi:hypothetical protein
MGVVVAEHLAHRRANGEDLNAHDEPGPQLKVAAAFELFGGRYSMTEQDWDLFAPPMQDHRPATRGSGRSRRGPHPQNPTESGRDSARSSRPVRRLREGWTPRREPAPSALAAEPSDSFRWIEKADPPLKEPIEGSTPHGQRKV